MESSSVTSIPRLSLCARYLKSFFWFSFDPYLTVEHLIFILSCFVAAIKLHSSQTKWIAALWRIRSAPVASFLSSKIYIRVAFLKFSEDVHLRLPWYSIKSRHRFNLYIFRSAQGSSSAAYLRKKFELGQFKKTDSQLSFPLSILIIYLCYLFMKHSRNIFASVLKKATDFTLLDLDAVMQFIF